jgi:hypothetical protein
MLYAKGDRVRHPGKREWGLGEVLEPSSSSMVRVYFVRAGEKRLSPAHVTLRLATGTKAKNLALDRGAKLTKRLSDHCIYARVRGRTLAKKFVRRGPVTFTEKKRWVTAYGLWQQARDDGQHFPILLSDAADYSRLLYWAFLTKMKFDGSSTEYTIDRLRKLDGEHVPQDLVLRRTRKNIAPRFIRSYAICLTPLFLAFSST